MVRVIFSVAAIVVAVSVGAPTVSAQQQPFFDFSACEGDISSLAPGSIPKGEAYTVDIFDPTDAALQFRDIFLAELDSTAKAIREDGNLVFSFRSESIFSGITSRNQVNPTYRREQSGSRASQRRATEDETRDLIRNDRRRSDTLTASQRIIVEAELRNKQTQRVLWLATVRCIPVTSDRNLLMKFVSAVFIENLGAAVKQKAF